MSSRGSIYRRCGCREAASGRQFGPRRPKLDDPDHGTWYLAVDVPGFPDGCLRHRVRRGGYPTREDAKQALAELRHPGKAVTPGCAHPSRPVARNSRRTCWYGAISRPCSASQRSS
jgi:hypothetical protein